MFIVLIPSYRGNFYFILDKQILKYYLIDEFKIKEYMNIEILCDKYLDCEKLLFKIRSQYENCESKEIKTIHENRFNYVKSKLESFVDIVKSNDIDIPVFQDELLKRRNNV